MVEIFENDEDKKKIAETLNIQPPLPNVEAIQQEIQKNEQQG